MVKSNLSLKDITFFPQCLAGSDSNLKGLFMFEGTVF
jgi:hypothetical protein